MQSRRCHGLQARVDLQAVSDVLHQCLRTRSLAPLMLLDVGAGLQASQSCDGQQHMRCRLLHSMHTLAPRSSTSIPSSSAFFTTSSATAAEAAPHPVPSQPQPQPQHHKRRQQHATRDAAHGHPPSHGAAHGGAAHGFNSKQPQPRSPIGVPKPFFPTKDDKVLRPHSFDQPMTSRTTEGKLLRIPPVCDMDSIQLEVMVATLALEKRSAELVKLVNTYLSYLESTPDTLTLVRQAHEQQQHPTGEGEGGDSMHQASRIATKATVHEYMRAFLRIRGSVVDAYEQLLRLNSTFAVPVSSCAPALIIKACDHLRCSDDAVDRAHVAFRVLTLMKAANMPLSFQVYISAINAMVQGQRLDDAAGCLDDMHATRVDVRAMQVIPTALRQLKATYLAMLRQASVDCRFDLIEGMLDIMEARDLHVRPFMLVEIMTSAANQDNARMISNLLPRLEVSLQRADHTRRVQQGAVLCMLGCAMRTNDLPLAERLWTFAKRNAQLVPTNTNANASVQHTGVGFVPGGVHPGGVQVGGSGLASSTMPPGDGTMGSPSGSGVTGFSSSEGTQTDTSSEDEDLLDGPLSVSPAPLHPMKTMPRVVEYAHALVHEEQVEVAQQHAAAGAAARGAAQSGSETQGEEEEEGDSGGEVSGAGEEEETRGESGGVGEGGGKGGGFKWWWLLPSEHMYRTMMACYANNGRYGDVCDLMVEYGEAYAAAPIEFGLAAQPELQLVVDSLAASADAADKAYFAMEQRVQEGKPVHVAMVNCIIAACSQLGDLARAWETYEAMGDLHVEPNIDTYNALAAGCVQHGRADAVDELFNEARAKGLSINRNSVGHMIRAAVVLRNLDRAVDLVEQALAQVKWDQPAPAVLDSVVHLAERMGNKAVLTRLGNKFPGRLAGSFRKAAAWQEVGGFQLLGGTNFVEYREHIVRQKFDISKRPVRTKT